MNYVSIAFLVAYSFLYLELVVSSPLQNDDRHLKNRIVGGTIANAQRYPYYTYLRIYSRSGSISFCGGSLVNPDVILTAAHCIDFFNIPIYRIDVLVNYTQSIQVAGYLTGFEHSRSGVSVRIHSNYDSIRIRNDIGLVYLDSPVYEVTPVNLNDNENLPADGDPVTVFGHGRISNAEQAELPYYLMEVSVPIVPFQDCNDRNSYWGWIVDQSMICAGASSGGKGTCNGDSGGPLIIIGNSATQDVQVGIVSFGSKEGCSIVNYPSVFTRVSNYREWIQDLICLYSNVKPISCSTVAQPTSQPTNKPVVTNPPTPTSEPTNKPVVTNPPTSMPTTEPTIMPVVTNPPTSMPTTEPTNMPVTTNPPTPMPTSEPTNVPVVTNPPTSTPTTSPTNMPIVTNPPTPTSELTNIPVVTNPPTPTSELTNIPAVTNPPTTTPTNQPAVTNPPTPTKKPVVTKAPTRKPRPTFRPIPAPNGRTKAPTRNPTVKKKKITPRPSPSPSKPSLSRNL